MSSVASFYQNAGSLIVETNAFKEHTALREIHMIRRFLAASVLTVFWSTAPAAPAPLSPERLDQVVRFQADNHQFMGSVLVAQGDTVIFSKSYGSANLEWNIPNSSTTRFRVGSITKQFTAAAILLLEERGKLKVEDNLKTWYPDSPAAWDKVTLVHLLQHTSGIHSYTDDPEFNTFTRLPHTPEEIVKRVRDKPLDFETGKQFNYSNTGYILLGMVIEKASGQTYATFLEENILGPLGMKDSGIDVNAMVLPQRATGYSGSPSGTINSKYIDMTVPYAAGAMYSTVGDLLLWQRALYGKKLLSEASLAKMTTPGLNDYAFGLGVTEKAGIKQIRHGGGINGFSTDMAYYPDGDYVAIALSNLNGGGPSYILDKFARSLHGETVVLPPERKATTVPRKVLEKYVGTYQLRPGFDLVFFLRGDQLISQATGQGEVPLAAESATRFFPRTFEADIEFLVDSRGKVTGLIHRQNGRESRAPRTAP